MTFFLLCKSCKLTLDDMEAMTIGMCLDYVDEYQKVHYGTKETNREATQSDFDSF